MSKMKRFAAMTAALLISANTMGYLPQDSIIISNVTANAAEEEITSVEINETNFPDAIFREYVKENFDTDGDRLLSAEEIADVTSLHLGELGISDLTGIQYFKNLSSLWCYDNNLTTLDVSNNTELKILSCNNNQLTSLDVSHNTLLTDLMCHNNQLASVDLSNTNCLEGWEFGVELNNNKHRIKITDNTFDLSTLPTGFDISKASEWTNATVKGNILTIEDITKEVTYTYDCGLGFSETFAFVPYNDASEMDVEINEITFPDAIFRKYIEENFDKDGNKILSYDELVKATFMKINGLEVSDMTGLQHFFNLQTLYCSNNRITSLDVSNNTELEVLSCYNNQITSLDVSNNAKLRTLTCSENQFTSLDLSNNPALTSFSCDDNKYKIALTNNTFDLSTLPGGFDISKASDWKNATVKDNILTVIDDTAFITYSYKCGEEVVCFNLFTSNFVGETFEAIEIDNNNFPDDVFRRYVAEEFDENNDLALSYDEVMNVTDISLDESNLYDLTGIQYFKNLSSLWCYDNNLTTLDVSENTALKILVCDHNELTSLDVSNNTALEWLYCDNNQLTSLDVSNNTALIDLSCYENQLTSLDLSNNTALKRLMTDDNKYEIALTDNTFDLSTLPTGFDVTKASDWTNGTVKGNILTVEDASKVIVYKYDLGNGHSETFTLIPQVSEEITSVEINETNFPDSIFRQYVAEEFDINGDSVLSDKEIAAVTKIDVYDMGISDLTGIEYFENLAILECMFNKLTTLDISKNTALIELNCYHNQLTSLDVSDHTELIKLCFDTNNITSIDLSNNTALTYLSCCATKLTSIDISNNTALITLHCDYNQFTSLDVSNNTALTGLYCYDGQLTSLDISKNTALETLWCMRNQLTSLDVSKNTALTYLSCSENQLTSLGLSNNTALTKLNCNDNQLTSLDVSNNTALDFLNCSGNQLTSLDLSNNTALEVLRAEDNKYEIALTDNTFDLSTLPTGFDVTKASEWTNATVEGNILTIEDVTKAVTYKYDFGNEHSEVFTLVPPKAETPATTTTAANTTNPTTTTTTFATPSYSWHLNVYPYDKADTIYEIGEELDYSTICVHGYGGGENFHADIPYISLANCSSFVTVDASEFDNTKPGTYTIYVKWYDTVDSFDVTVVESDNAETPAETTTTTAAPKTTDTTTTTTAPKTTAMFTTTTFAPPSYSCSLSVYPYDEADTIYEIGEELDYSTICVHGYGTMTSFGSTSNIDIPYMSLADCSSFVTVDASEFDNTKPGTYTIYVKWYDTVDSFDVTVVESDNAETPAETTTTTAAPETTITTTATTTVTTTPATTTPEDDLPQTGFSKLYNCIPVSAGALVLLGMYAVKKSRKEDEEE